MVNRLLRDAFLIAGVVAGLGFASQVSADERIVTLLPSYAEISEARQVSRSPDALTVRGAFSSFTPVLTYLYFSADALPAGARVENLQLRLVQKGDQPNASRMPIDVASIQCQGDPCRPQSYDGLEKLKVANFASEDGQPADVVAWRPSASIADRRYFALILSPGGPSGRTYYSSAPADVSPGVWNQPRLIVTYSIASTAPALAGVQADGDANARSTGAFMPPAGVPRPLTYAPRDIAGPDPNVRNVTRTPASFDGFLYLIQSRNQAGKYLDALGALGRVEWSVKLPADPGLDGLFVVVNSSGRLSIVGGNRIIVYQLNTANRTQPPTELWNAKPGVLAKPSAVMPGPDGSLYLIDEQRIYTLNPDLRLLWLRDVGSPGAARMTLGPDGRFVYAAGIWREQGTARKALLLAINAQTGQAAESRLPSNTDTLHAPVVVRHKDGADYVFVGANSGDSGILRCVMNNPLTPRKSGDVTGDTSARLGEPCNVGGAPVWSDLPGRVSQPFLDSALPGDVLSKKKLLVVREPPGEGAALTEVNPQTGVIRTKWPLPHLPRSSPVMETGGTLLFLESGRLYGLSPAGSASSAVFSTPVESPATGSAPLAADAALFFGPGGTLYANRAADGALRALVPRYCVSPAAGPPCGSLRVDGPSAISSPTHLQVDGIARQQRPWVFTAAGDVVLGSGFTLEPGATVTVSSTGRVILGGGFTVKQGATFTVTSSVAAK